MRFLGAKCAKNAFAAGAPDSAGGADSAPPDPLAGFKGPTSKGSEGMGGEERRGKGKEWKGRGREGKGGRKRGKGRERVIPVLLFPHFEP